MIRLADFIERDMQEILAAWDTFARKQVPAVGVADFTALRDHAKEILQTTVVDLRTPQTADEQRSKSLGESTGPRTAGKTAAETHGQNRASLGFEVEQVVAEYRALRACVLRLWARACDPESTNSEDVMRFNEAIDQALAESIALFAQRSAQERDLLLSTLGHDMRGPLQVILASASALEMQKRGSNESVIAMRIQRSGIQLKSLLDDLVDINRIRLGRGLPVEPVSIDLAVLFNESVEQLRTLAGRDVALQVSGDVRGSWDPQRVQQVLNNLVINAVKYGSKKDIIRVQLAGMPAKVDFRVINKGPKIDASLMSRIFDPLVRGSQSDGHVNVASLGLGLHIARQIVEAHGGRIDVTSDDCETTFLVQLPREARAH